MVPKTTTTTESSYHSHLKIEDGFVVVGDVRIEAPVSSKNDTYDALYMKAKKIYGEGVDLVNIKKDLIITTSNSGTYEYGNLTHTKGEGADDYIIMNATVIKYKEIYEPIEVIKSESQIEDVNILNQENQEKKSSSIDIKIGEIAIIYTKNGFSYKNCLIVSSDGISLFYKRTNRKGIEKSHSINLRDISLINYI